MLHFVLVRLFPAFSDKLAPMIHTGTICQNYETEKLKWLSSQQALADLAAFQGYLVSVEGLTGKEKWVTWGGKQLHSLPCPVFFLA